MAVKVKPERTVRFYAGSDDIIVTVQHTGVVNKALNKEFVNGNIVWNKRTVWELSFPILVAEDVSDAEIAYQFMDWANTESTGQQKVALDPDEPLIPITEASHS